MRTILVTAVSMIVSLHALADESSNEDRLRDALRQAVTQMRAAQDQAAQAQAELQKAQNAQQSVQAQLDAANAKLSASAKQPAAPAADMRALQSALAADRAQNIQFQQGLARWQAAYQAAAALARSKDQESRQANSGLQANSRALDMCKAANTKLIDVAEQTLHLYESQSFRSLLLRSYEPVIGMAKVRLENMVQDYDDKIRNQEYIPPARER